MIINGKKLVAWEYPVAFLGRAVDEAVDEETVSSMFRSVVENNPHANHLSAHDASSVRMWCRRASEWVRQGTGSCMQEGGLTVAAPSL